MGIAKILKWGWLPVLAVGAGAFWYFKHDTAGAPQFQTAAVTRGDIVQAVTATGTLNPVVNVTVGSQISGIIQSLYADYNTPVKSNQIVAQLDPATYKANVAQAEGDLANAKANMELMQIQSKRADDLFAAKLIAESDHDTAIANLHQAQAQVKIKEATLANAQVTLQRCTIYAPVDGVVISRSVDVGQTVAASMSAPVLFTIANDLAKMQIDSNVAEADIGTVEQGQSVTFTVDAFPGRTFNGKVVQIRNSPTTVQNVVTYDVVIAVSNPDLKLRPGMTANVSIISAQRNDALKIANGAFRFKPADAFTNLVVAAPAGTNQVEAAEPPLTGNEPPAELQRRVREMRDRGDEIPAEIRSKLREYYQSGVLQRPAGGGGGGGGSAAHGSQPMVRTVYTLGKNDAGDPVLQTVRVKTGISDGITTEVIEGLNEGDKVVTSVTLPNAAAAPAASPFGGGGMMPRR
jgi:HlyD family secretion protein